MNLQNLCTNCMSGSMENGVCPKCKKPAGWEKERLAFAIPARHLLGGQYYIGKVLGSGGFGITYLAWDTKVGRRVAVKELYPNKDVTRVNGSCDVKVVPGQEDYFSHIRQRFLEEAQSLYEFSEVADIIDVYRLFQENHTAYYAMEFLEGMDLKTCLLKNGRMSWEQLSEYIKPTLRALAALHEKNMIHRDISPDNIFLTKGGGVKLIDFGSLRCYNNANGLTTILKHNFAPYEQYRMNGNQGPWTDIYSLSVTMYYALSGVLPPKAPDRILTDNVVPIKTYCPGLPEHVADAITKGMAVQTEQRYQNVYDFGNGLFEDRKWLKGNQNSSKPYMVKQIHCVEGILRGRKWELYPEQVFLLGRDKRCLALYPPKAPGISRLQCSIMLDRQGRLFVRDENSTYGTFINGTRLQGGRWYAYPSGSIIRFAGEQYQIL